MEVLWRKLNNLKLYLTARWALRFRRGQRKCSCIIGPARNNNREKLICVSRTLSMKQLWSTNVINVRLAVAPFVGELASEQQTYFRSSLLFLRNYFSKGEKRPPEIRLLFAGYWRAGFSKSRGLSLKRFLPSPPHPHSFIFWLSFHFRLAKTEKNPFLRSFFAPKPHGNAYYAGSKMPYWWRFTTQIYGTPSVTKVFKNKI